MIKNKDIPMERETNKYFESLIQKKKHKKDTEIEVDFVNIDSLGAPSNR